MDATGVSLSDTLPVGVSLVSATPSQGPACTGSSDLTCNLGSLVHGATATVTVVTRVDQIPDENFTNQVTVTGNEPDLYLDNNTSTLSLAGHKIFLPVIVK